MRREGPRIYNGCYDAVDLVQANIISDSSVSNALTPAMAAAQRVRGELFGCRMSNAERRPDWSLRLK